MSDITEGNMKLKHVTWRASMGKQYAFITVEDLGRDGKGFKPAHYKKYWGEANINEPETLRAVMNQGGKWDSLP